MDSESRAFIENSTLLFIATRNAEGALDVSPRGGQPSVLHIRGDGALLLPDYKGNRRLDAIGNLLSNPEVALLVINRGVSHYLHIRGTAGVSFAPEDIAAFPADESLPISVLIVKPEHWAFVGTNAFARGGLWPHGVGRKAPLDLSAVVRADKAAQASAGFLPVRKNPTEEHLLTLHGVREVYGTSSEAVQTKVFDIAGPGGLSFMQEARFIVFAHEDANGDIVIDLTGEAPLSIVPFDNRHAYHLQLPPEGVMADGGAMGGGPCALVTVAAGRSEILRVNGHFERNAHDAALSVKIIPHEVFFHCPAALNRSRIWQDDRRVYWVGRRRFTCAERHQESPEVVSFVFRPLDRAPVGPAQPGQYVTVSLPQDSEPVLQRSYSLSRLPDDVSVRISVRRTGNGGMSDVLHDRVEAGSAVYLGIPAGRFVLDSPAGRRVALISAGVGITPMIPMLEQLAAEDSGREVWFLHAARDSAHHLFPEEVRRIAARARNGGIRFFSAYSRPMAHDVCDHIGRIDGTLLAALMPVADTDFYICGPEIFMHSLRDALVAHGATPDSVRFEAFSDSSGGAFDLSNRDTPAECEVTFARSGKTATWTPAAGSLLDLALASQVKVAYSCRIGDCQSCLQQVVEGAADYPMGEMPVLAQGQILLCRAIPRGRMVIQC